jgi:hypothetical protein
MADAQSIRHFSCSHCVAQYAWAKRLMISVSDHRITRSAQHPVQCHYLVKTPAKRVTTVNFRFVAVSISSIVMPSRETIGAGSKPEAQGPSYWIFVPALLICLWALWKTGPEPLALLPLSALAPSLLGVGLRWAGERKASAVCAVIVLGCYWFPMILLILLFMARSAMLGMGMATGLYLALFAFPLGIFGIAATGSFARNVGTTWAMSAVLVGCLPAIVLAGIAVEQQAKREQARYHYGPQPADPMVLKADFLTYGKCIQDFARAHPDKGFPESLESLGPEKTHAFRTSCRKASKVNSASSTPPARVQEMDSSRPITYRPSRVSRSPISELQCTATNRRESGFAMTRPANPDIRT